MNKAMQIALTELDIKYGYKIRSLDKQEICDDILTIITITASLIAIWQL